MFAIDLLLLIKIIILALYVGTRSVKCNFIFTNENTLQGYALRKSNIRDYSKFQKSITVDFACAIHILLNLYMWYLFLNVKNVIIT